MSFSAALSSELRSGGQEALTAEQILRDAFEKLHIAAPKKNKELRDSCILALDRLQAASPGAVSGDDFFFVLRYGCECQGAPKAVSIALHAIQKLVLYGFLTGRGVEPLRELSPGVPQRSLLDSIVESVCGCAEQSDDTVQLQMVQVLMAIVTSHYCEIHNNSLMLAVRTCFQIHRDSRNAMNQRTASSSLQQMLSVISQRIEFISDESAKKGGAPEDIDNEALRCQNSRDMALLSPSQLLEDWTSSYLARLCDRVVLDFALAGGDVSCEKPPPGKFGWCVVCRGAAPHYCVETQDPVCCHACKFKNLDRIALVEAHYGARRDDEDKVLVEELSSMSDTTAADTAAAPTHSNSSCSERLPHSSTSSEIDDEGRQAPATDLLDLSALTQHQRDALLVFSALCQLSMKDLPPGQSDSRFVRSKRLALELILGMIQNCGPAFKSSGPFIAVLKDQLCVSLIKNSVSSIPKIFGLSLQIFVMLTSGFKEHLRAEIGVFIEQIFLRILESGNSTYQHKHRVLHVFYKLCTDAATALELFLNFDCDVNEKNIFGHMIDCLSKIAQGKYTSSEHSNLISSQQEHELKKWALQALVKLMGSVVEWSSHRTDDQTVQGIEGRERIHSIANGGDSDEDGLAPTESSCSANPSTASAAIMEQKQRKHELQVGVNKFNMKPKRGIEYLKQSGFIKESPEAIAQFLQNNDIGLDKTAIGDYLGEDKPLNKSVLYALVDRQSFRGLELDVALRTFLAMFRLPGEAQKIDRMMEKFAEKYCQDNPDTFANPDCAFVLSFSLIMLQTDLHNPGIKSKMTKEDFVRNNRGINDNADLPTELLHRLYQSVAENPISLKEDEDAKTRLLSQAAQGASQKLDLFLRETESIVTKSQDLLKARVAKQKTSTYVLAENVEHVRPLFETACWPMLAMLAVLLETQDQTASVELCIEGFKHCIRIAARFDLETERDAFVSSLAKFTYLTTIKEMKQKNIECIKALLAIGLSEGSHLGPSWQHVLHCISHLERLQLIGSRGKQDFIFFDGESPSDLQKRDPNSAKGGEILKRRAHGLGVSALVSLGTENRQVEQLNSESVTSQIDPTQIDLIFNRSAKLTSGAIVHFVTQLARVSKEELASVDQPRIFSLQRLVEVADFNMSRLRYVWARVWRILSGHFVEVASHTNIKVSMYGIDSLRQLAMKFLEKDELSSYNFQADFLKPFGVVMQSGVRQEVKELIVSILSNMVQARIHNIKSGWKIVLHVCQTVATDSTGNDGCAQVAFAIVEKVIDDRFDIFIENFGDGLRVLMSFGQSPASTSLSLKAIKYLVTTADKLAEASAAPSVAFSQTPCVADSINTAETWFPILRGLATLVSDPRREVREAALPSVFGILKRQDALVFDEDTWRMVFNGVIKPLFDDIHHQLADVQKADGNPASWTVAMAPPTCLAAMTELSKLFAANLDSLAFLLDDVLKLMKSFVQHETEAMARIGIAGLKHLLLNSGKRLSTSSWEKFADSLRDLLDDSIPTKLLEVDLSQADGKLPFSQQEVVIQCVVHLLLIDTVQDLVPQLYDHIPLVSIMMLLQALKRSVDFAQRFNQQIELRQALKQLGFMREMKQLPGLLKQEREALGSSLKILFRLQQDERLHNSVHEPIAGDCLLDLCASVLRNYIDKDERLAQELRQRPLDGSELGVSSDVREQSPQPAQQQRAREAALVEMEREMLGLVATIRDVVLGGLADLQREQFARFAPRLFPLLCELVGVSCVEVRGAVRRVLVHQVRPLMELGCVAVSGHNDLGQVQAQQDSPLELTPDKGA